MPDNHERNYPPRRHKKRQINYLPLIFILVAVLLAVVFIAVLLHMGADQPGTETTGPAIQTTAPTKETDPPPTPPPTEPPITVTGTATIGATGDILMHMPTVRPAAVGDGTYNFDHYFTNFASYAQAVDYAVANLETTLAGTDNGYNYSGYPNFNCPDGIVTSLRTAGFDMLLTANNHTYDTRSIGFFRTQEIIAQNGMDHIGTKPDEETDSYLIKNINGIQVGMICYTYETNADPDKINLNGGANFKENEESLINVFLKDDVEGFSADLAENMADMYDDGAEAIVLYIHWGEEYQTKQNSQQKAMAQAACDLGVDVIVGGHPHVIQPIDLLTSTTDESHKTVCLYSTGNAMSNQRLGNISYVKTAHTEDGIFFTFSFVKYSDGTVRLEEVEVLPLWVNLYTSSQTGKKVYDILPLDKDLEDWKTEFSLTDSTLSQAQASYDRTMKIVGGGLEEVQAYLQSLPEIE